MRTLFFGSSEFALPSLRTTHELTDVIGVVTQPDRPSGRGQRLVATPVKTLAMDLGLTVYEPTRMRAFAEEMAAQSIDLAVLASYGRILPQALLDRAARGALNVHPSLLPRYRGATPIQTALRNGDRETGVSIMLMDAGMDSGEIVSQARVAIDDGDDYGSLHDRLAQVGAELLGQVITQAAQQNIEHRPQSGTPSVTAPLKKDDTLIDAAWDAQRALNAVRAFSPSPLARMQLGDETVKIVRAHVADDRFVIDELIAPNRGRMSFDAYMRSRAQRCS